MRRPAHISDTRASRQSRTRSQRRREVPVVDHRPRQSSPAGDHAPLMGEVRRRRKGAVSVRARGRNTVLRKIRMARKTEPLLARRGTSPSSRDAARRADEIHGTFLSSQNQRRVPAYVIDRLARTLRHLKKLRVGVVGCGQLARTAHIPLLERHPAVEIVGLCDPGSTAIDACASLAPDATRHDSIDALFDSHSIDAVVIALPSHLHTDAAIAAFRHGPMSISKNRWPRTSAMLTGLSMHGDSRTGWE